MDTSPRGNRLLAALQPADLDALLPGLEPVELKVKTSLSEAGVPSPYVHFMGAGVASILLGPERTTGVEVGIVGREGLIGLEIVLGAGQSPHQSFIQVEGHGWRLPASELTDAMATRPDLRAVLLRFAHCFSVQVSSTAYANADFTVEERLARWLLLCSDRLDSDDIYLTHEFLSLMLGVRRPGVTVATHVLEGKGMIRAKRSLIRILDRGKLEEAAGSSYGMAEAEYVRLLGGT